MTMVYGTIGGNNKFTFFILLFFISISLFTLKNNIKLIILLYFKRNKPPLISVALESMSPLLESVKKYTFRVFLLLDQLGLFIIFLVI